MEVKDQLLRLVRIQELILETRAASAVVEGSPARIEEIEGRFRERNAEYVSVKQRFEALDEDQRSRSGELETLEEHRKKYMADLMQVQNQREYAAMLKEIDAVKSQISENEDAVLKDLEEIETVKTDLASHESHIQEERKLVEKEVSEVKAAEEAARKAIGRLDEERKRIESELAPALVSTVQRLEDGRQGQCLSEAIDGICQSCFVRVRPQVFQEIKLATRLHSCGNCKRLLFHKPSLEPESAEAPRSDDGAAAKAGSKVEAINGGAV